VTGQPVLVDALRTPFGKRDGWVAGLHAASLLSLVQRGVLDRTGVPAGLIDQVIGGCVTPIGEQYGHIARTAWLYGGLPPEVGATTIDAQCSTSMQASLLLAGQIAMGAVDVGVACGVELMSRVPLTPKSGTGPGTPRPADWPLDTPDQYTAADRIARHRGLCRADLDTYGLRSQERAAAAWAAGRFDAQVLPVAVPQPDGDTVTVDRDQGLRETRMDALARLRPVKPDGLHTAGTSSQVSDGAGAAILADAEVVAALGLRPRARLVAHCVIGGDLELMLDGPVAAAQRLFDRTGLTVEDIDVFEVNEAFAAVPLSFARAHGLDPERLNLDGGAIALGHPAGATGIRLLVGAVEQLERTDGTLALIAICASASTSCVILERLSS